MRFSVSGMTVVDIWFIGFRIHCPVSKEIGGNIPGRRTRTFLLLFTALLASVVFPPAVLRGADNAAPVTAPANPITANPGPAIELLAINYEYAAKKPWWTADGSPTGS